jgi:Mce-associated membrane protein
VEDQPTDTSDLTKPGDTATAPSSTPVGKRGRHRSFRPRPATASAATSESTQETVEAAVETAEEPTTETAAEDVAAEPKAKRRGWFRRRARADTAAEEVESTAEEAEPLGATTESEAATEEDGSEQADEQPVETVERKPAGRRLAIAVAVAAALFVAAGAFGGAMLQPYLANRVVAQTKLDIARTATDAITTLFTYTPDDMAQLPARSAKYLGGELKDSYAKQVDALAATNKQSQIHRNAQVVGAAVESLNGEDATAMVYANITYTSAATKDVPKIYLVSYRLSMQRKGSDWVIVNMPWITSKDLTKINP